MGRKATDHESARGGRKPPAESLTSPQTGPRTGIHLDGMKA
jgi:hypothetical protein